MTSLKGLFFVSSISFGFWIFEKLTFEKMSSFFQNNIFCVCSEQKRSKNPSKYFLKSIAGMARWFEKFAFSSQKKPLLAKKRPKKFSNKKWKKCLWRKTSNPFFSILPSSVNYQGTKGPKKSKNYVGTAFENIQCDLLFQYFLAVFVTLPAKFEKGFGVFSTGPEDGRKKLNKNQ